MPDTVYTLTFDAIQKLNRDHERLALEVQNLRTLLRSYISGTDDNDQRIGKTDASGVSSASASQLGSGNVVLWSINATGAIAATSVTVTAYNLSGSAVAANKMVKISRVGAVWIVDVEDCS